MTIAPLVKGKVLWVPLLRIATFGLSLAIGSVALALTLFVSQDVAETALPAGPYLAVPGVLALFGWAAHDMQLAYFLRFPAANWLIPRSLTEREFGGPAVFGLALSVGILTAVPFGLIPGWMLAVVILKASLPTAMIAALAFGVGRLVPLLWSAAASFRGCPVSDLPHAAFRLDGAARTVSVLGLLLLAAATVPSIASA